jgi:hypothetical protein
LCLQGRFSLFDLALGSCVGFRDRVVAFPGPLLLLQLPRLEDPGTRSPQLLFVVVGGGSRHRRVGLFDRPFGTLPPLVQYPGQGAVNQQPVKNNDQKE